jgi:hypothetical protein
VDMLLNLPRLLLSAGAEKLFTAKYGMIRYYRCAVKLLPYSCYMASVIMFFAVLQRTHFFVFVSMA